jgi:hypothetical protein
MSNIIDFQQYRTAKAAGDDFAESFDKAMTAAKLRGSLGDDYDARWEAHQQQEYDARYAAYQQAEEAAERAAEQAACEAAERDRPISDAFFTYD